MKHCKLLIIVISAMMLCLSIRVHPIYTGSPLSMDIHSTYASNPTVAIAGVRFSPPGFRRYRRAHELRQIQWEEATPEEREQLEQEWAESQARADQRQRLANWILAGFVVLFVGFICLSKPYKKKKRKKSPQY